MQQDDLVLCDKVGEEKKLAFCGVAKMHYSDGNCDQCPMPYCLDWPQLGKNLFSFMPSGNKSTVWLSERGIKWEVKPSSKNKKINHAED